MPFPPSLETDFELVEQLPDCKILEAFRVRDRRRGRAEVILRLLPAEISQNPDIVSSFHSYFTRFSDIRNRMYIPAVYSVVGTVNRNVYVLEEYVSGISLSRFIEMQHTSPTLVRDVTEVLARGACEALHHAHQKGIFHLCITPEDILINEDNSRMVKLVGFGAQIFAAGKRLDGFPEHSRRYIPPEVFAGKEPQPSSDIYSLALAVKQACPDIEEWNGFLSKCLSSNLSDRPSKAREFGQDLKRLLEVKTARP